LGRGIRTSLEVVGDGGERISHRVVSQWCGIVEIGRFQRAAFGSALAVGVSVATDHGAAAFVDFSCHDQSPLRAGFVYCLFISTTFYVV
jgi:hypothetical protein